MIRDAKEVLKFDILCSLDDVHKTKNNPNLCQKAYNQFVELIKKNLGSFDSRDKEDLDFIVRLSKEMGPFLAGQVDRVKNLLTCQFPNVRASLLPKSNEKPQDFLERLRSFYQEVNQQKQKLKAAELLFIAENIGQEITQLDARQLIDTLKPEDVAFFIHLCPNLTEIHVPDSPCIPPQGLYLLLNSYPYPLSVHLDSPKGTFRGLLTFLIMQMKPAFDKNRYHIIYFELEDMFKRDLYCLLDLYDASDLEFLTKLRDQILADRGNLPVYNQVDKIIQILKAPFPQPVLPRQFLTYVDASLFPQPSDRAPEDFTNRLHKAYQEFLQKKDELNFEDLLFIAHYIGNDITTLKFKEFEGAYEGISDKHLAQLLPLCPNVREVDLNGCREMTVEGINWVIKGCPLLESLTLCHEIYGEKRDYDQLLDLPQGLKKFDCKITTFDNRHLLKLKHCSKLEDLHLSSSITNEGLAHLKHLKHLRHLDLSFLKIDHEGLRHLSHLHHLRELILWKNDKITTRGMQELSELKNLRKISIRDCKGVTQEGVTALGQTRTIENVELLYNENLKLMGPCPNLKVLSTNHSIGGTSFASHQLQRAQLYGPMVTDEDIAALAQCSALESLSLASCSRVKGATFHHVIKNCKMLRNVEMKKVAFSDEHLLAMDQHFLHRVNLSHLTVSDEGLKIFQNSVHLEEIILQECDSITDKVGEILASCPNLTRIVINSCEKLSEQVLERLSKCSNLREISFTLKSGKLPSQEGLAVLAQLPNLVKIDLSDDAHPSIKEQFPKCVFGKSHYSYGLKFDSETN